MNHKIQQLFSFPLPEKAEYAVKLFEEFTIKELEELFPILVADIFGLNSTGWGLRALHYGVNPRTYNFLLAFFHPSGPFLKMCYKLLSDSCVKYDFSFQYLPESVCHMVENGVSSSFYQSRAQVDHRSKNPVSLSLNPLELFIFNFGYHLVNPWVANVSDYYDAPNVDTLYLRLSQEYLSAFLPLDSSQVLPPVYNSVGMHRIRSSVQSPPRTMKSPKLFKPGVFLLQEPPPLLNTRSQIARPEIWRSELFAQVLIDFWLNIPNQYSRQSMGSPVGLSRRKSQSRSSLSTSPLKATKRFTDSISSGEHFRLVRIMIKHFHYFSNSRVDCSEAMLEFRRSLIVSCQKNIYLFLKEAMQHWPIDSSFRLVEETWLSFIQPWRYTTNRWRVSEDFGSQEPIDNVWLQFIATNILFYTNFFQQVIGRFARLDLATPKNSCMLFRFTKVFATPNLMESLKEVESGMNRSSSLGVLACQSILDMEGSNFNYEPITGVACRNLCLSFTSVIKQALHVAECRLQSDQISEKKSLWSTLFSTNSAQESIEERKKTPNFLFHSLNHLKTVFPDFDCVDGNISFSDDILNSSFLSASFRYQDEDFKNSSQIQKGVKLRYQGDPDLQPIRSWECAFLVRILVHLSFCINTLYKDKMKELYERSDLTGGIARQILRQPQVIYYYDKHSETGYCPRVSKILPPRLSLRTFASYGYLLLIPLVYLMSCFFDKSIFTLVLCFIFVMFVVMFVRFKLGYCKIPSPNQPLDESGCSNYSYSESD